MRRILCGTFAFVVLAFVLAGTAVGAPPNNGRAFACTDYTQGKVFIVAAVGAVEWEYQTKSCNDLWVLPDGNLLFCILSIVVDGTTARSGGAPTIDGKTASAVYSSTPTSSTEHLVEVWYVTKDFAGTQFTISIPNTGTAKTCHVEVVTADAGSGYSSSYYHGNAATAPNGTDDGVTVSVNTTNDGLFIAVWCEVRRLSVLSRRVPGRLRT